MYAWVKAFHVIFMVTWFAGLFYLPRLYVYHAMTEDAPGIARFKIMERKLYRGIMTPGGLLTLVSGVWLVWLRGADWFSHAGWLHLKLALVMALVAYHLYLGRVLRRFASDDNRHGHVYYRWLNEAPVLVLVGAVVLVILQPF
ncbi:MAG: protoporphyrinogen oxidase HemJ [Proteobacteria bacterium]|nr:protoporphyrinogen oxidase HemJ [Pseudomonadota bacterium]